MRRRIVVPGLDMSDEVVALPSRVVRHVAKVLRLGPGDEILLLDGDGAENRAAIETVSGGRVTVRIIARSTATMPSTPPLHLVQSLPKGGKLDEIIRRATELGVASIRPVISERSIARPPDEGLARRLERWRTIAAEAARQCGRAHVPEIDDVTSLDESLTAADGCSHRVMLWEGETSTSLGASLAAARLESGLTLLVGPEGGFSDDEAKSAADAGFVLASMGRLVLRVETAAIASCAVAQLYLGGFDAAPRLEER